MSEPNLAGPDRRRRWRFRLAAVLAMVSIAGTGALLLESRAGKPAIQLVAVSAELNSGAPAGVGCTGRVEPLDGVIVVAATPALGRTPVIDRLLVKEGQMLTSGQLIAVLQSLPDLESAVKQADARVAVAESHIAQLQAGARTGEVLALKSDLARLEIESNAARKELDRKEALARKDFVPQVQVEAARVQSEEARRLLEAASHRLESLTDVRDSDLNLAKAELASAEADRDRARVEESAGTIRSPAKGRVLQIVARPGEAVGPAGVVTMADTSRMTVIAQIYETDIARVHTGQKAVIRSESLKGSIAGVVGWISPQIAMLNLPVDPSAPPDQRVYQARIDVDRPEALADRIYSKVTVLIEP